MTTPKSVEAEELCVALNRALEELELRCPSHFDDNGLWKIYVGVVRSLETAARLAHFIQREEETQR